jgi:integrase
MKRKVVVTYRWLEPPPLDRHGNPLPRNQWPRYRRRSWVVRWHSLDGRRRQRSFRTKQEAEEFAAAQQAEFDRNPAARRSPQKVTLQEYVDELARLGIGPRGQKLMPSSARELQKAMAKLVAFLGPDVALSEISAADAVRFAAALRAKKNARAAKRPLSAATVNKILRTVKVAFSIAVRQLNYLRVNPFANIAQQKLPDTLKRYVTPNEFLSVLEACGKIEDKEQALWWQTLTAVLYTAGTRLNEALHLTWSDVDFERDTLRVIARDDVLSFTPKGKRSRTIPLPERTMGLLTQLQLKSGTETPYVFIHGDRLKEIRQAKEAGLWSADRELIRKLRPTWASILSHAEVEKATFHDLRRSAITNWARRVPAHVTQRLAGHVAITTTMQFYVSVLDDDLDVARQAIDDTLEQAKSTRDAVGTQ